MNSHVEPIPGIAALILAGGRGVRLGSVDKALLELRGRRLIDHLLPRLRQQVGTIAISANGAAGRFAEYGLKVLADGEFAGKGPLAGLAIGLEWAKNVGAETLLTAPVDTPLIPLDLARRLGQAPAVAAWQGRQHHLVAIWQVAFLPALQGFLRAPGDYKVRDALAIAGARAVEFGGPADPFLNINTIEDLAAAEARLEANRET